MTKQTFTASNGLTFTFPEDGSIRWESGHPPRFVTEALREYFQHERDEELGRWRDPEDANMVVYRAPEMDDDDDGRAVRVVDEATGTYITFWEGDAKYLKSGSMRATADRYFAAYPEPRPWHDAKPGELWVLTIDGKEWGAVVNRLGERFIPRRDGEHYKHLALTDPRIETARRVFPEPESYDE